MVVIAAVLGAGVWSTVAIAAPVTPSPGSTPVTVAVVEDAPVCPAEQIEAPDGSLGGAGVTVVSFTLVDPRCE